MAFSSTSLRPSSSRMRPAAADHHDPDSGHAEYLRHAMPDDPIADHRNSRTLARNTHLRPLRNNRETKTFQDINGKRTAVVCDRINVAYAKWNLARQDTIGEFAWKKDPKGPISSSLFPDDQPKREGLLYRPEFIHRSYR